MYTQQTHLYKLLGDVLLSDSDKERNSRSKSGISVSLVASVDVNIVSIDVVAVCSITAPDDDFNAAAAGVATAAILIEQVAAEGVAAAGRN